jgi:hypothetical protein
MSTRLAESSTSARSAAGVVDLDRRAVDERESRWGQDRRRAVVGQGSLLCRLN